MRIEVFDATKKQTNLRLVQSGDTVELQAVFDNGSLVPNGSLARFNTDGTVTLRTGVNATLGFQLDGNGRVKVAGDAC